MECRISIFVFGAFLLTAAGRAGAQATVTAKIDLPVEHADNHSGSGDAVLWLEPLNVNLQGIAWPSRTPYRLLQKNRTFSPHLLVIPVGASVAFPNADTYFHNVFSLFEGSRFDLGLYEAGSTREVHFNRKGVSYIFCNIHPEMGAVVLSLETPLWATFTNGHTVAIKNVPSGTYEAHLWVEGQDASSLARWQHTLVVSTTGTADAGTFHGVERKSTRHMDKFGNPYKKDASTY